MDTNTNDPRAYAAAWEARRARIDREVQLGNLAARGSWAARLSLADTYRALAWLAQARGTGPYSVLELRGAAGSGRSILLRVLAELAAGGGCALARLPSTRRDLASSAHLLPVVAIDDAGLVTGRPAKAICQVAAGELRGWRRADTLPARPVILVGNLDVSLRTRARFITTVHLSAAPRAAA